MPFTVQKFAIQLLFYHKSFSVEKFSYLDITTGMQTLATTTAYLSFAMVGFLEHVKGPTTASTHVSSCIWYPCTHLDMPVSALVMVVPIASDGRANCEFLPLLLFHCLI